MKCHKCSKEFRRTWRDEKGVAHNLSTRKFCFDCSPFKGHNTSTTANRSQGVNEKSCTKCKQIKSINEFGKTNRKGKPGLQSWCKKCQNLNTGERMRLVKAQAVAYLGGKCQICNYSKCLDALDFHHRDPKEKEFNICSVKSRNFEGIKKELDKCDLLCSNCHREIHSEP